MTAPAMQTNPRSADVPPSIVPEKKGLPNGFRTQAASSAILIASVAMLSAAAPQQPTRRECQLVDIGRNHWTVKEFIVRPDGSRRFISMFTLEGDAWSPAGVDQLFDMLTGETAAAAPITPAAKKKELLDSGIAACCGQPEPVCENFCGCIINVEQLPSGAAGGSSSWCKCADEEPGGDCPDDWPDAFT